MSRFRGVVVLCSLVTGLSACEPGIIEPDENGRAIATIEHHGDPVKIETPTDVVAGVEFNVTVTAYGGGCVTKGETEIEIRDLEATVTPYEYDAGGKHGNTVCTADLRLYEHVATLRFDKPGTATVVFRGKSKPSLEAMTVRRTIVVR